MLQTGYVIVAFCCQNFFNIGNKDISIITAGYQPSVGYQHFEHHLEYAKEPLYQVNAIREH